MITTPEDQDQFQRLLGDGSQWGLSLTYIIQPSPDGLAQAYLLARDFLAGAPSAHGVGRQHLFRPRPARTSGRRRCEGNGGARFLAIGSADPERYGVVDFDSDGQCARDCRKACGAAVEFRGDRALLSWMAVRPSVAPQVETVGAGRAWKSPTSWKSTGQRAV
ncbi:MAG: sugar phosphate nucleotidyltransferase [Cypionkella sp.]